MVGSIFFLPLQVVAQSSANVRKAALSCSFAAPYCSFAAPFCSFGALFCSFAALFCSHFREQKGAVKEQKGAVKEHKGALKEHERAANEHKRAALRSFAQLCEQIRRIRNSEGHPRVLRFDRNGLEACERQMVPAVMQISGNGFALDGGVDFAAAQPRSAYATPADRYGVL